MSHIVHMQDFVLYYVNRNQMILMSKEYKPVKFNEYNDCEEVAAQWLRICSTDQKNEQGP